MAETGVIVEIRDLILRGDLPTGARVTETGLAEMLGVSRTPIRNVLPALEREGLLERRGARGFAVRSFSAQDSLSALELRSAVEGIAARLVAQRGASDQLLAVLHDCLQRGDALFAKRSLCKEDESAYGELNGDFHTAIVQAAQANLLLEVYARVNLVPFAAPGVIAFERQGLEEAFTRLFYAHGQHHAIVDAIKSGDGSRAEFLFREHANQQRASMWAEAEEQMAAAPRRPRRRREITA